MKRFAALYSRLDATTSTTEKVAALADYFRDAPDADRIWTIALLSDRRPKRAVTTTELRLWAAAAAGLPDWLFEDAYAVTGDLAETIALVLPEARNAAPRDAGLAERIGQIRALARLDRPARKDAILAAWDALPRDERFLFNKLITGGFRIGISQGLMTRALSQATGIAAPVLQHRLMGDWSPDTTTFTRLVLSDEGRGDPARPYPFFLAHALETSPEALGEPGDWFAEWKWDGIRGQFIRRGGAHHLWSRGEDLMTARFPELASLCDILPDGTVIDGEVLAWRHDKPLPFADLQARIGRKTVPKSVLARAPVILMAYDLLEDRGRDLRARPFADRRARLADLLADLPAGMPLRLSPEIAIPDWPTLTARRAAAPQAHAEGVMLKRRASAYGVGRRTGDWWKWKLDPMTIDAVMIYAQAGHGRRANLFTDYTFAVRDDAGGLLPFAKAYSGLTDAEFTEISDWVRRNTIARWGPVRSVAAELVFEIGFEGIQASPRHKSGIALRFPRMLRWRRDKPASEIDTIATLRALLVHGRGAGAVANPGAAPDPGIFRPR